MKIFSAEWAKELQLEINKNQEYKNSSEGWEWALILSMSDTNNDTSVYLDLNNGECREARLAVKEDFDKAEFIISAGAETWKKILSKTLSPMQAMMLKKLIIKKGSMSELLPYVNSLKELLNSAMMIAAE
ncbi:MAG: SCP2 sterol-binding domain-containing protein [Melioribacteraceae bacterium]|nr:SCP2 sterol-binding domain-containing protein [Melioribacteraceae bacterium]